MVIPLASAITWVGWENKHFLQLEVASHRLPYSRLYWCGCVVVVNSIVLLLAQVSIKRARHRGTRQQYGRAARSVHEKYRKFVNNSELTTLNSVLLTPPPTAARRCSHEGDGAGNEGRQDRRRFPGLLRAHAHPAEPVPPHHVLFALEVHG